MKRNLLAVVLCFTGFSSVTVAQEIAMMSALDSVDTGGSSPATGTAALVLSSDLTTLRYSVTVNNLVGTITGAHFHSREDGSVLEPISFVGNSASGVWNVPDSAFEMLITDNIYINVHTTSAPGGEIRGRVQPSQHGFSILLDGAQAGTSSAGKGTGVLSFGDSSGVRSVHWRMTYAGLQGTRSGAHFHSLPGGGIVKAITFTDSTAESEWVNPPDSFIVKLFRSQIYVNIHTGAAPGGEIRGTPAFVGEIPAMGYMDGQQAGTSATGQGTVWTVLRPDLNIYYSATVTGLTGSVTGSHLHTNRTGGIAHPVTMTNGHVNGTWISPSDQDLADFVFGRLYFNVHTAANSGGEVRANLGIDDGGFTGVLDGAQAGTSSSAKGTVWLRFEDEDSMSYNATYSGLEGTYSNAHFHLAPGGGVIVGTPFTAGHASGWWSPDSMWYELLHGNVYMNIHSSASPGGEIRASLRLGTGIPVSVETRQSVIPSSITLSQNYPNPFNPRTTIVYDLPRQGFVSIRVYNLLGQTVSKLVGEVRPAGSHIVTFDAGRMATGIYLYTLNVDGKNVATRRMVYLK